MKKEIQQQKFLKIKKLFLLIFKNDYYANLYKNETTRLLYKTVHAIHEQDEQKYAYFKS